MDLHDIVVIGGSAGAWEALKLLAGRLPATLPAAVFAVLHISERNTHLASVIGASASMPVLFAADGDPIRHGRMLIAPSDRHLLLKRERVTLGRGPLENSWRPSVDALFRSAAVAYGPRVIGVILSGMLDDGSAGLRAIERRGGLAIVQDPAEAEVPAMPLSALRAVPRSQVMRIADLIQALPALAEQPAPEPGAVPEDLVLEVRIAEGDGEAAVELERGEIPTSQICPECGGPLKRSAHEPGSFRCLVGHSYSLDSLAHVARRQTESSLWMAIRLLQQRANLNRTRESEERQRGRLTGAQLYAERAAECEGHANVLRSMLMKLPE